MSNKTTEARIARRLLVISLLGGCCVDCGSTHRLEFDHVFPEDLKFRIATRMLARLEVLLPELQKCQLLCRICHIKKTQTERIFVERTTKHGEPSMYTNHKCRCDKCKQSWNEYLKNKRYYRKSFA